MKRWTSGLLAAALILSSASAGAFWGVDKSKSVQQPVQVALPDFSQLAEQTGKWVVNISTTKYIKAIPPQFQGVPPEILKFFFGIDPRQLDRPSQKEEIHSLGSGFIIRSNGYILTNNHVVEGADDIIVRMSDRREFKAEVLGRDKATDVALLKIDAENLPAAKIGSSRKLKVGQWVIAIGEPFGLDYTVTHGIVSAKGRSLPNESYVPFIQTDVPINPGNSGGPLINMNGEVVGINSQIFSKTGGYMGLSFAIPIEIAMNVANQLMTKGKVERGFLGVTIQEVSSDLAESFGMSRPYGALVAEVGKGTPAEKAGIRPGDIIIEYNGQPINKSSDLPPLVGITTPGERVKIVLLRNGKRMTVSATVTAKNEGKATASTGKAKANAGHFGAAVRDLTPEELAELRKEAPGIPGGVLVEEVFDGAAAKSGLRPGDIIVSINFHPVHNVAELKKVLRKLHKGRKYPMRVLRRGGSIFLPLVLE
ncbi:serine protease Do [Sulfurivirga caldicuralii]|uniref:Probable periplasmic serine endoprotease DegP-like n=1 Tax=Sulfurivirga caldicuralii TaxID=364032 RepID=A0A1N6F4D3_9GAMM|nr:DegQ family serine endoprotease [Sulfurivirga caldicuralii]SIN90158.1 serine protease Do [Sulfurivirga caldicuralii]